MSRILPDVGQCTSEMAHAMSRLDGYDHDRDMPGLQRWMDYWDAAVMAAPKLRQDDATPAQPVSAAGSKPDAIDRRNGYRVSDIGEVIPLDTNGSDIPATPAKPVSAAGSGPVAWRCRCSDWDDDQPWDYPTERPSSDYAYDIIEPLYATPDLLPGLWRARDLALKCRSTLVASYINLEIARIEKERQS